MKNQNNYVLKFCNGDGVFRDISAIAGGDKMSDEILALAYNEIRRFCSRHNFTIYIIRAWNSDDATIFDVGSHTEFFYLFPALDI
jgi:phosphoribosylformylglycinamidine (FGAM) synthase-like amidotransferase family enzyme